MSSKRHALTVGRGSSRAPQGEMFPS
jgi:hypothetical protein